MNEEGNFSTFSVRAITIVPVAVFMLAPRMVSGGLMLIAQLHTVTIWIRLQRVSTLKMAITAVMVLPSAV